MDTEARAREVTAAFLSAQRERIVEGLSEGLKSSGAMRLLPVHSAPDQLVEAIRKISQGRKLCQPLSG